MARAMPPHQDLSIDQVVQGREPSSAYRQQQTQEEVHNSSASIYRTLSYSRSSLDEQSPDLDRLPSMRSFNKSSPTGLGNGTSNSRSDKNFSRLAKTPRKQGNSAEAVTSKDTIVAGPLPGIDMSNLTDFFNPEVFHMVLHNPTTAHRFLRFCQSRACGENIEFLQKISAYNRLLDDMATALGAIHTEFVTPGASKQINIPEVLAKDVASDLKEAAQHTLPGLEMIFGGAQEYIEKLLASDIYPRFVKHQMTASATMALAANRERYNGLGDCFCMTDPQIADNPIIYASDGFISVTGYSRREIIPRNCRFLQGKQTDPLATTRLKASIAQCEETVELLLNYRKDGTPFWNLLYCAPLFNEKGEVTFFLGGQINCSTTIHSCTDVLKVLSINDDELSDSEKEKENKKPQTSGGQSRDTTKTDKPKSSFFKSWKKFKKSGSASTEQLVRVRDETGMEGTLLDRVGKMNFKTQVEAFYTAYSKYLVLEWNPVSQILTVQHFSPGIIDMLCLNLPNGTIAPIHNRDIFTILSEHSSSPSKALRQTVREALRNGKAVSVEMGLLTGFAERKNGHSWFVSGGNGTGGGKKDEMGLKRVEERYVTHWTPLKTEEASVKKVVLTIAPKL